MLRRLWLIWLVVFVIVILSDIPQWVTDPNWVEFTTLGGGFLLALYTIWNRWQDRKRARRLIFFSDDRWQAIRDYETQQFRVETIVDVLVPHHSIQCVTNTWFGKERILLTYHRLRPPLGTERSLRPERWTISGYGPLSILPEAAMSTAIEVKVTLDGNISKKSGRRTVMISQRGRPTPLNPDMEGSQTQVTE